MRMLKLPRSASIILTAVLAITAGVAWAQDTALPYYNAARVTNLQYGIVCYGSESIRVPAPDTITGFINQRPGESNFIVETLTVPVIPGLSFGVRVEPLGSQPLDNVTLTVIHPPQTDAGVTTESWTSDFDPGAASGGSFTFEYPYEETPGPWIMEASHGGELLYRVRFDLVDPASLSNLPDLCEDEALIG